MVRTTRHLVRTIWFPLVQMEALILLWTPPSFAALFPATPGRECAGGECGHTGWPNRHSVATIDSEGPPSQVVSGRSCVELGGGGRAAVSICQRGAGVHRTGGQPRRGPAEAGRLGRRAHPVR